MFYIDLMHTSDLSSFTKHFAKSIVEKFDKRKTSLLKSFGSMVKSLKPILSFDPVTGNPMVEIRSVHEDDPGLSLEELFQLQKSYYRPSV